jgi:hypothetical protein
MQIPGVPVGQIPREGEIEVEFQGLPGIFGVFGVTMKHPPPGREPVPENVQHIVAGVPVMDNDRHIKFGGQIKLGNKKLDLGILVPEFTVIIQTDLPHRHHPGKPDALFYGLRPIPAGILHLRRGNPHRVVYMGGGFKVFIYHHKIMETIAYRNKPGDGRLPGLLNNNELFNRVITNEPYMGVSIKILHGLVQKNRDQTFSKLDTLTITQLTAAVNEMNKFTVYIYFYALPGGSPY